MNKDNFTNTSFDAHANMAPSLAAKSTALFLSQIGLKRVHLF